MRHRTRPIPVGGLMLPLPPLLPPPLPPLAQPLRRGPRPLALHLSLAMLRGAGAMSGAMMSGALMPGPPVPGVPMSAMMGFVPPGNRPNWPPFASMLPNWSNAWRFSSAGQQEARRISSALGAAQHPPEAFAQAVWRELFHQDQALLRGIAAYRCHPWRAERPPVPVLWQEGGSRLLDYGQQGEPVLVIPSLVNRAQVLDLDEEASLLRFLAEAGLRPLLLDWGWPGEEERRFGLDAYIARLGRALEVVVQQPEQSGPPALLGYCMGGLLALAAARLWPQKLRALGLLATPWDFHAENPARARALAGLLPLLEPVLQAQGVLPTDALQMLFTGLDPFGVAEKYRQFGRLDPHSGRARRFVALEDWLNDGIPLAAPVARECLEGWYGQNQPMRGQWKVAGQAILPQACALPAFVAIPARDRIVPPGSALALAAALPCAHTHAVAAGHIGMTAGFRAKSLLWQPLSGWLRGQLG